MYVRIQYPSNWIEFIYRWSHPLVEDDAASKLYREGIDLPPRIWKNSDSGSRVTRPKCPLSQLLLVLHHTELHTMIHTLLFLASCTIELHSWRTWREGKKSPEAISTFRLPSFGVVAEYEASCKDAEGQKLHTSPPIYLTTSMTKVRPFLGIRIKPPFSFSIRYG